MAASETPFVIDSDTLILIPSDAKYSNEELATLLAGVPQLKPENITRVSISNSLTGTSNVPEMKTFTVPVSIQQTGATFTQQITPQIYSNQVLTPISPNVLTPESSPIVSHAIATPKTKRSGFLTHFDESPLTPVSSCSFSNNINRNIVTAKPNVAAANVCNQLPTVNKNVPPFGTLVFFDLETTGLGHIIGKSNVQITEISMVAVDRKEFWQSKNSELKEIRIMHKLSMCVRPRCQVSSGAAKITGLDNFNLIDQYPFDKNAATTIVSFLSHLPKPVCLLAHNGNAFDFPLLKSEFKRISMELPSDLLIADTLIAFRSIGIVDIPPDRKVCKSVKYGKNGRLSHSLENLHLFFFNKKPTNAHSSEGDCLALAKVCHKLKENALPYLEANAQTLDKVIPMW